MTERISELLNTLRDEDNCNVLDYVDDAADMIESLAAELEQVENKLSELLYYVTGGRFSKTGYSTDDMRRFVNDYNQCVCDECDELEQVKQERNGLDIMLGQAQSMLETRTRERDAAIEDIQKSALYLCQACRKYHPAAKGVHEHFCEQLGQRTDFYGVIACGMFEWRGVQEADNAEND